MYICTNHVEMDTSKLRNKLIMRIKKKKKNYDREITTKTHCDCGHKKRMKKEHKQQTNLTLFILFICVSFHLCHSWIHTIYNTLDQNSTYVLVNSWTFRTRSQIVWYTCCTALVKSLKNPHSKSGQENQCRKNHIKTTTGKTTECVFGNTVKAVTALK